MNKKRFSIFLSTLFLLNGCSTYQKTSMSLEEVTHFGKVKIESRENKEVQFKKVSNQNGEYFGLLPNSVDSIRLYDAQIASIYVQGKVVTNVWLKVNGKKNVVKGIFYELSDSIISLSNSKKLEDYKSGEFETSEFNIMGIESIELRRNGRIARGALLGALASTVAIPIIGFAEDSFAWILYPPILALSSGIGAAIGMNRKIYVINGSILTYQNHLNELKKYAIRP